MTDRTTRQDQSLCAPVLLVAILLCLLVGVTTVNAQEDLLEPYIPGEVWPPERDASSSGLRGNGFFRAGYVMRRSKDSYFREITDWSSGSQFTLNLPITKHFDWETSLGTESVDGQIPGTIIDLDSDYTNFESFLIFHMFPEERFKPFFGVGLGAQRLKVELTDGFSIAEDSVSSEYFKFKTGFEFVFSEYFSIQTYVTTGELFDSPDLDAMFKENVDFYLEGTTKFGDRLFGSLALSSDFRNTDIEIGYLFGFTY